jgi:signal transduction histidine kinase
LYALLVVGLGALLQAQGSPAIGLAAAGIVALLFAPLRDQLQRSVNRLLYGHRNEPYAALTRLGRRLEAALAPEEVLPIIVRTVAEALKLPYVAISLQTVAHSSALLQDGSQLLADDDGEVTASYGDRPATLSPDQLVAVPLNYQGDEVGRLLIAKRCGAEAFSAADQRLVADLARQGGAAAHTVQLTRELQVSLDEVRRSRERLVTAQEEERRRIQRDLHDGLGPVLASMRLRLEACLDAAQAGPSDLADELERLHELVGQASTDIRRLVYDLRPPALDQLGLVPALRQHTERFSRETGIAVQLSAETMTLAAAAEVAIFRIVQEALTNVHKHARAAQVTIRLGGLGEALLLEICDDGVGGVTASRSVYGGTGVASMRERAELLGGTLVMRSPPGAGTTVEAYLPLWRKGDE